LFGFVFSRFSHHPLDKDAPLGDPVIYNIQSRYAIGAELRINCTSFDYRPAARLHWIINGKAVRNRIINHQKKY
jgi:hypothetical protein